MSEENLCVLIDFENIAAGTEREGLGKFNIRIVLDRLKEKGRLLATRAYGDWGRYAKFKQRFLEHGVSMMELTSYRGQDKNRADIALVVDAMEMAFTREHIGTYVLLSGDSDFTPLVMRLRELNKRVIGMGTRKSTSRLLASSCDEFIFYDSLLRRERPDENQESDPANETTESLDREDAFSLMVNTIKGLHKENPAAIRGGVIKQLMLRKHPTFDESDYNYDGFTAFLRAAQQHGLISLVPNKVGGGFMVDLYQGELDQVTITGDDNNTPQLSEAAQPLLNALQQMQLRPTTKLIRHTVLHEFVDHITERVRNNKRNTLFYTYGDINRRCRKTAPIVAPPEVKAIIDALHASGQLIGNDGLPVRSKKAQFILQKDAEELGAALREYYTTQLLAAGIEVSPAALSELIWNDLDHIQLAEETLAWASLSIAPSATENNDPTPEIAAAEIDVSSPDSATGETETPAEPSSKKRSPRKRSRKKSSKPSSEQPTDAGSTDQVAKTATDQSADTTEPAAKKSSPEEVAIVNTATVTQTTSGSIEAQNPITETDTPAESSKKPRKRRTTRKKTLKKSAEAVATEATPAPPTTEAEESAPPVKRRRGRPRKSKAEPAKDTSGS